MPLPNLNLFDLISESFYLILILSGRFYDLQPPGQSNSAIAACRFAIWGVHQKAFFESYSAIKMSFTKSEFVCDSSAIRLRVGCGHKHACVSYGRAKMAIFGPFFGGRVRLAGRKSQQVEAGCGLNLLP